MSAVHPLLAERRIIRPTGVERTFPRDDVIVSKTDLSGMITYVNDVFCRVSGFTCRELMGANHNIIRHPDMPRCMFRHVWRELEAGGEVFAYVLNLAADGAHYWVFAHLTPTRNDRGEVVGYHSNRRSPDREPTVFFGKLYQELKDIERAHSDPVAGMDAAERCLADRLASWGTTFDELVFAHTRV